ncbi:acetate--CoA ligase [Halomonas sp. JS92-SW72]|uniref:acetate--CoA ligase n=1 Tax=Halomonas sp. JS92-SW72 TaxID=2306583 RepID=UPI000E5C32DB|nr:acetate--CoA ligase [Halomonas sp. JS92-SW72]AXY42600.1 acetate--CoA ligase [Halomonas sp. JS92-SW72]
MRPSPTLPDYAAACASFSWRDARTWLPAMPGGGINIAHAALDRHLDTPTAEQTAIRFLPRDGAAVDISYRELAERANRFANLLASLGLEPGDGVYCLAHRTPDLYAAALGTLKLGGVFTPLFSAFGPEPIRSRVEIGTPVVIVTTERLYRRKLAGWLHRMPSVKQVLLIGEVAEAPPGTLAVEPALAAQSPDYPTRSMEPEAPALLHFTSGTTGRPKGALHVHEAVVAHHITGYYALDLHPGDIYWCTADPGWVTGTSYGIIAPFTNGVTLVVDEEEFDAERWYRILEEQRVAVWYTAPTAIRMLMKVGPELARRHDLSSLRFLASVGEPLNPEAVHWGRATLGLPFHDNWWQTETGGIMIANFASMPIKPGSMGRPVPGIEAGVARRTDSGIELIEDPDETGELVLKAPWPSMFRGYLHEEARYRQCFAGAWYLTGDLARRDAEGYFWFIGRADDVIKSAGHLIGPFEVESVLMEHPAVAEAGVIGIPDEIAGETVKAFVSLKPGHAPDEALRREILGLARQRLGPAVAPRQVEFRERLPSTRSGKIMRRLLRARELGLPEGDTSTLEGGFE